ncbi:MAG: carboxypeptidase-like regulatory domain-containing protein [Prevotella sp.]|nr:carboxypeptidase-like regulatory domain-containing protein [Prevotella sp.]
MTRTVLFVIMLLGTLPAFSQRQLTVADVETLLPVAGVSVQGKDRTTQTDSLGRFALPDSSRTLVFSHVNYESRIVNMDEVASDTVFIISKLLSVKEVVVFGKVHYEDDGLDELRKSLRIKRTEAQLLASDPSKPAGIPLGLLGKLIPKKWRSSYKKEQRKKRHEEILREY